MKRSASLVAACAGLLFTAVTSASPLTTVYGGSATGTGKAVYFDILVGSAPITVTGLDTNTDSLSVFDMAIYRTAPGSTAFGNETNAVAWGVPVATGEGTGAGTNQASAVTLSEFFTLEADTSYGIALVFSSVTEHRYSGTFGNGPYDVFSNGDLTLTAGTATASPFTGFVFTPRVWNGSVYYTVGSSEGVIPEPSTIALVLLAGGLATLVVRRRAVART